MKNRTLAFVLIGLTFLVLILLFFGKEKLNCFVTNYHLRHNNIEVTQNDSIRFFKQFKNTDNPAEFQLSLIELGGFGCKPCMQMDTVLLELKSIYGNKVKIETYRVTDKTGRKIAKYFGVNTIPTQIVLNKSGKEVFRHTGFLSKEEIEEEIGKLNN